MSLRPPSKILFLDFDGTLFQPKTFISDTDLKLLKHLAGKIIRVIATGRSLFSIKKVINDSFPIDYLIFSTGVGIMDWRKKIILHSDELDGFLVDAIITLLRQKEFSFFVHDSLPHNHYFYFNFGNPISDDFKRRLKLYKSFARPLKQRIPKTSASQIIVITDNMNKLKETLKDFKLSINLIRATSPLDGQSNWFEILSRNSNKSLAAKWLTSYLKIEQGNTIAIGNDFNDLDLLNWVNKAFVMNSAPKELKKKFSTIDESEAGLLLKIRQQILMD